MRVLYPETGLWQAKELGVHVLWMSDSPDSPTGFGNVTRFVCSGLADLGHRVSILGWQTKGTPIVWHSCQLYPTGYSDVGADVLLFYLQRLRPDVLITLGNIWWLSWITYPLIAANGVPWWLYYPLDGDCGEGRLPESWVQVLRRVDLPVAMSRYGLEVTARNGVAPAYIPHGVDTGLFRPPAVKAEAKAAFGYRERFVILSDARNQARKLLPRTLEIFRRFAAGKPDVVLHLHCEPDDPSARRQRYRYDLRVDVDFLAADGRVRITPGMSLDSGGYPGRGSGPALPGRGRSSARLMGGGLRAADPAGRRRGRGPGGGGLRGEPRAGAGPRRGRPGPPLPAGRVRRPCGPDRHRRRRRAARGPLRRSGRARPKGCGRGALRGRVRLAKGHRALGRPAPPRGGARSAGGSGPCRHHGERGAKRSRTAAGRSACLGHLVRGCRELPCRPSLRVRADRAARRGGCAAPRPADDPGDPAFGESHPGTPPHRWPRLHRRPGRHSRGTAARPNLPGAERLGGDAGRARPDRDRRRGARRGLAAGDAAVPPAARGERPRHRPRRPRARPGERSGGAGGALHRSGVLDRAGAVVAGTQPRKSRHGRGRDAGAADAYRPGRGRRAMRRRPAGSVSPRARLNLP